MKEVFNKTTNSVIISSILACIVGIIMVAFPNISLTTIGIVAAIYIILHGIALIVLDIKARDFFIPFDGMISGVLSIVLGFVLIFMPNVLTTIFTIALGVWIVVSSINLIKMSMMVKGIDEQWFLLLILGILDVIAGIIVIFNPFAASLSLTVFAGMMIIVHSVITFVDMIILKKDAKEFSKVVEAKIKDFKSAK